MESPEPSRIISAPPCPSPCCGLPAQTHRRQRRERRPQRKTGTPWFPWLPSVQSHAGGGNPRPIMAGNGKTMSVPIKPLANWQIRGRCGEEDGQTGKKTAKLRKRPPVLMERRSNWQTCRQFGKRMGNRCCPNLNLVLNRNRNRGWKRIKITMKIMIGALPAIRASWRQSGREDGHAPLPGHRIGVLISAIGETANSQSGFAPIASCRMMVHSQRVGSVQPKRKEPYGKNRRSSGCADQSG